MWIGCKNNNSKLPQNSILGPEPLFRFSAQSSNCVDQFLLNLENSYTPSFFFLEKL